MRIPRTRQRRLALAAAVLSAVVACAAIAAGASGGTTHANAQIKVGLITKTDTNPFFVKMKQGATKQAKELGVTLLTAAGKIDGDAATQITAIENMVSAGVKGILITPSNDSVIPAIK